MSDIYGFSYAPEIGTLPETPRTSVFDGEIGPWSRRIAVLGVHECHIDRRGDFYDKAPTPHGWRYIGKSRSDEDAYNRWKNYLDSIGVEPSAAKRVKR